MCAASCTLEGTDCLAAHGAGITNVEDVRKSAQQPSGKAGKGAAAAPAPAAASAQATDAVPAASVATMRRFLRKVLPHCPHAHGMSSTHNAILQSTLSLAVACK